jgi:uncharacterized protein YjbI with pentapeptide repeats
MGTRFSARLNRYRGGARRGLILVGLSLIVFAAWTPAARFLRGHEHQWRILVAIAGAAMIVAGLWLAAVLTRRKSTLLTVRTFGPEASALPSSRPQEAEPAPARNRASAVVSNLSNFAAVIALIFTGLSLLGTKNQLNISEQGQVTDRYNAAIANLGSSTIDIRLGGIYALQRLMIDSPRDRPTIIAVLCAFVRDQSASGSQPVTASAGSLPTDLQAAVSIVGRARPASGGTATLVDLDRARLAGAHLDYLGFAGANLTSADLAAVDFSGARLQDSDLAEADLTGAVLTGADLASANLAGARLARAHVNNANLSGADFRDADLTRADLSGAGLSGASFAGAKLPLAILEGADLAGLSFAAADLSGTDLTGADLRHGYLVAAQLTRGALFRARLSGADLTGADLTRADIRQGDFTRATLSEANLAHVSAFGARLRGADLSGANLTHAVLNGADLVGANFSGADLTDMQVVRADLTDALWPASAAVPAGWRRNPGTGRLEPAAHTSRQ